ncbi:MAG: aspartyl protease family protein [Polaribacter sp.]|uniref:aspartyl protease family protein n=1 Tax=Polaribacter sp. TaxID=1920175 RepID=UPI00260CB95E|nr:aspartyl protease family protein [Polaribacter sp.]MDG1194568.1 aspartyl protease family protein [Polaribacter sp.]MDG1402852.1 aspartyl protease family protein [Polaribacter sp.]MDG2437385.1 aspartyl protease family protein [Polaribacter sp.]
MSTKAQKGFHFLDKSKNHQRVNFELINNLIVIPLKINGKKLSFILDSGVSKTILFNITKNDSIGLKNVKKVQLQGLGKGESVDALLSYKNSISLKNIVNSNETIYVILQDHFDLSGKMGKTIHGIIGYNILSHFIVKVNYKFKKIDFYNPDTYTYKKCRKCEVFPIQMYRRKPYIQAEVQLDTIGSELTFVKLLVDSGGSDAIWLFENTKKEIKTPKRFFNDILGEGLSGAIYGNRSRIPKIKLGAFEIQNPTVSFLDSVSTKNARSFQERNGSIGAGILRRFKVWFDYPNKKIMLKRNSWFSKGFNYNMTGLDVVYNGKQLVKEQVAVSNFDGYQRQSEKKNAISFITSFAYKFKSSYRIKNVIKNSPGDKVGLKKDDIILKINDKPAHELTMNDIILKFQERDQKKIKIIVSRNGKKLQYEFRLEKKV